jgi:Leucine-rich repeat (LRR) protein
LTYPEIRLQALSRLCSPLTNLTELLLGSNKITDIGPLRSLANLTRLSLGKQSDYRNKPLKSLTNLDGLYLYRIGLQTSALCSHLPIWTTLSLWDNQITNIKPLLAIIKKGLNISLFSNPLTVPPLEVVQQGNEAIISYFEETKKQGEENLYEAKIVIVGAGESGKTTLIKKLLNPDHPVPNLMIKELKASDYTITVQLYGWRRKKRLKAHIWDFGGQELYHTTHQLFLTPDTLYVLLNDNRKNDTDFYYWLNIVTLGLVINAQY